MTTLEPLLTEKKYDSMSHTMWGFMCK